MVGIGYPDYVRAPRAMNLDIDCIRTFVHVAETMSFSRAAERVCRSQSTVSQQIGRLEQQVGKPLFERRKGRVIEITRDGRKFLRYAGRILRLNDAAYSSLSEEKLTGTVRLGAPLDFFGRRFTEWLARFQGLHPMVGLEVETDQSDNLIRRTARGEFDLAFFKQDSGTRRGDVVLREHMVWAAGEGFAGVLDEPVPLILFPEGCAYRRHALAALGDRRIPWRIGFVSPSFECLRTAVAKGLGVTVLARALVAPPLRAVGHNLGLPTLPVIDVAFAYGRKERPRAVVELAEFLADSLAGGA
jgi:DNA-binding transcriptional LysR family regulator